LITAIGKLEHPDRIRGVGQGMGIRKYFGLPTRHGFTSTTISMKHL